MRVLLRAAYHFKEIYSFYTFLRNVIVQHKKADLALEFISLTAIHHGCIFKNVSDRELYTETESLSSWLINYKGNMQIILDLTKIFTYLISCIHISRFQTYIYIYIYIYIYVLKMIDHAQ